MKYNKPNMEIIILEHENVVYTSNQLGDSTPTYGGSKDYEVPDEW